MIKSGMQSMFESMIGEQGVAAIENVKCILPEVPTLIQNIKDEWNAAKERDAQIIRLLERVATQNNIIQGKLEQMRLTIDPIATEELPPTLAHHLAQPENAESFVSKTIDFLDERETQYGVNSNRNSHDREHANG